ncbi:PP2C family serine/threonine-protein phosphatase [Paenarthrobacter ureafaciens]|uniref:PP2C family serine/threonine-protein phosphatase n=1 Tax=Paenarthrobacter ureafaciens TaxID=37931 RepID=UPI00140E3B69|nr:PP2C family serine/threonine-protein phosphatase [Paenarthrobacter ureafaciens]MCX8452822.1 PP2C family serine/threonine-protein phosphatase [Paenarthrobacter ureafaciens]MCY0971460.1 PP2C family serine/threonine-protein phosphatase [Paenarthrobacter ureafaciens]
MFREFHYQVRGRGHVLDGSRGQDRTAYLARSGVQVVCLSDGAGSAPQSEFGAQALVDTGCKLLSERFGDFVSSDDGVALKLEIVNYLLDRLHDVAERRAVGIRDLASTFLAVATAGDQFLVLHVGDGVVGYVKDGIARVASGPDNSEFANQTTFLTSERSAVGMRIIRGGLDGITGFILMSDGTANSLYNSRTKGLAPACAKIVELLASAPTRQAKNPKHKKQLRRLMDTKIRVATKDDCAIAVLARNLA